MELVKDIVIATHNPDKKKEERINQLFTSLWRAVARALKDELDSETVAQSVLHFAFMTNGQLACDYDLALKIASESLVRSSEKVRECLEANSTEEQPEETESAPVGATLH